MGRQQSTSYRQGATGLKTEILNGYGRHFLATISLDLASELSNYKFHPWPPFGMGFGENIILSGGPWQTSKETSCSQNRLIHP